MTGYNTTQNRMIVSRAIISALALLAVFCGMVAAEQLYVNGHNAWDNGYSLMEPWAASADATPVVTITAPVSGSIVNTPNVTVTGFATDDVGIIGMAYAHCWDMGGSEGYGPINASTNVSINWTVYLQNGTNTMRVTAVDEAGNSGNASVTVIYDSLHNALTTTDAAIALQIAVGSRPPDLRWDVSGDGSVTSLDALMILQAAAGNPEDPITGCGALNQRVLRMYDQDKDGQIDADWMEAASIDLELNRILLSEYDQVKYAYEHNCPVEPAE